MLLSEIKKELKQKANPKLAERYKIFEYIKNLRKRGDFSVMTLYAIRDPDAQIGYSNLIYKINEEDIAKQSVEN